MLAITLKYFLLLNLCICPIKCAKILAIFPYPGFSQYAVAETYLKALAARGHQLTVISHFPQKQQLGNFTDVTLRFPRYEKLIKDSFNVDIKDQMTWYLDFIHNVTISAMKNSAVRDLLKTKPKFDLVITEVMLTEALYAIAPYVQAQLIGISSFGTDQNIDQLVGNLSPLSYVPIPTSKIMGKMGFWERLTNIKLFAFESYFITNMHFERQLSIYKKYFPRLPYELTDIRKNFSLVLLNQHFSVSFPRPYIPNMVEVAGMYINSTVAPLPPDVEEFINGTGYGVIYVNMGNTAKYHILTKRKLAAFVTAFAYLQERVIWQFVNPDIPNKPPNVLIKKKLPQSSILAHKNVKLFVTNGDSLSTIEAIHHAKPVVGIPFFFDHYMNMASVEHMGFGIKTDFKTINDDDLAGTIQEVLDNEIYTEAAQEISKRFHDQPMKPLDKAIYWTEYVLRHKGAPFMRALSRDLNFFQYYNLDAMGFVYIAWILALGLIIRITYTFVKSSHNIIKSNIGQQRE